MKIHKAITPKKHYDNPTLCCAKLNSKNAHIFSRTRWAHVSCKKCLKLKRKTNG